MDSTILQLLIDERDITALLHRYCRGVDRLDEELIRSCYYPDSHDDHGTFTGSGYEFAAHIMRTHKDQPICQHALTNISLDIQGDVAFGESYSMLRTTREGKLVFGFGRYIDQFERRVGQWRITRRIVTLEGQDGTSGFDTDQFAKATRNRLDPSYNREFGKSRK